MGLKENLKLRQSKSLFEEFLFDYKEKKDAKVVIFGAGDQGMLALKLFQNCGVNVYAFCDNDQNKQGSMVKGIPVLSAESLGSIETEVFLIINDSYFHEKKTQVEKLNFANVFIYRFDLISPVFKGLTRAYIIENLDKFEESYACLEDAESKKVFIGLLNGVLTGELECFEEIMTKGEYFPDGIVPKSENHIFVDVGAYTGDTIQKFLEFTDSKYEKIFAFEPMPESIVQLKENIKDVRDCTLFEVGASNQTGSISFYCNDYGANDMATTIGTVPSICNEIRLKTDTIDNLLGEEPATFIKMDIEGSELAALQGAENTIRKNRPFMAVCVYHKKEDLIDIIQYIKKVEPNYKLYLRHHSMTPIDTVLYCVYDKRGERE